MKLKIITSSQILFDDEIATVTLPGTSGTIGILPNHAPLISTLEIGDIKITFKSGSIKHIFISGGLVKIIDNEIFVLADEGDLPDKLVKTEIENAIKKAEEKLSSDILPEELIRIEKELQYQKFKRKQLEY